MWLLMTFQVQWLHNTTRVGGSVSNPSPWVMRNKKVTIMSPVRGDNKMKEIGGNYTRNLSGAESKNLIVMETNLV